MRPEPYRLVSQRCEISPPRNFTSRENNEAWSPSDPTSNDAWGASGLARVEVWSMFDPAMKYGVRCGPANGKVWSTPDPRNIEVWTPSDPTNNGAAPLFLYVPAFCASIFVSVYAFSRSGNGGLMSPRRKKAAAPFFFDIACFGLPLHCLDLPTLMAQQRIFFQMLGFLAHTSLFWFAF